jgi:hypothetical protein
MVATAILGNTSMKWLNALSTVIVRGASRFVFVGFGVFAIYWSFANEVYFQAALSVAVTAICLIWIYVDMRRVMAELQE